MGRTRHAKRRSIPITTPSVSRVRGQRVGDKLPISASSTSTRSVIRQFHVLIKQREQILRAIAAKGRNASGADIVSPQEELVRIERSIDDLGGLERYQAMSSIGQSAQKGGGSESLLISWMKELLFKRSGDAQGRLRCVLVVSLSCQN